MTTRQLYVYLIGLLALVMAEAIVGEPWSWVLCILYVVVTVILMFTRRAAGEDAR